MHLVNAASDEYWQFVARHCSTRNSSAPWRVQQHVAALIGDNAAAASAVHFQTGDELSAWKIQIATEDGRLVMVHIEFEHDSYDYEEEQHPFRKNNAVRGTVKEAWARRLRDTATLALLRVQSSLNAFHEPIHDQVDVGGLALTFRDGVAVPLLADQIDMYNSDEKARADDFIAAIRTHSGL